MPKFDEVYAEYFDVVYSYALRLSHDPALAEEVTQEAFFKALKKIDGFRGECQLRVWLCQIAKNTYYSLLEKRRRSAPAPEESWPDPAAFEDRFADRETALAAHRELHALEEPYREVFWLRVFGELNFGQIAGLFGKSESWARVTYHRAKMKLKERLDEKGY
ncbi:RNA polymerase sigma factor [Acutalibacter sp. 1XD8-33]|uniref:RNA polymerase sigma factor n=1 Tax=Acutalibacter sp. 1XD8-33 TaxID=2320081 RepID=UPI000EA273BD|nr:RNA polymerase sigma factor [Acutalibacter sp. 1XD8-33]RKJ39169.1 RNA polymerase sigma factor [Acutalibacter sp. 1XD8-33]